MTMTGRLTTTGRGKPRPVGEVIDVVRGSELFLLVEQEANRDLEVPRRVQGAIFNGSAGSRDQVLSDLWQGLDPGQMLRMFGDFDPITGVDVARCGLGSGPFWTGGIHTP